MSVYRENVAAELSSVFQSRNTLNLHDYEMLSDKVARVVLSTSGSMDKDQILSKISTMFGGLATPVRNSFRKLTDNSLVGFLVAAKEVRPFDPVTEGQKYRALASNILMSKDDQTTWELKEGASGKYLCRQGVEDLSELTAAVRSHRVGIPTLANIEVSTISPQEFVGFVGADSGDMDYGFVVARTENDIEVLSLNTKSSVVTSKTSVVQAIHFDGDELPEMKDAAIAKLSPESVDSLKSYYTKLYAYAPDYLAKVIDVIEQQAAA